MRRALIDKITQKVISVIEIKSGGAYTPLIGTELLTEAQSAGSETGAVWTGTAWDKSQNQKPPEIDWKARWAAATTVADKVNVIRDRLELA